MVLLVTHGSEGGIVGETLREDGFVWNTRRENGIVSDTRRGVWYC